MNLTALVLMITGAFIFTGALLDWNWFMDGNRARLMSRLLGSRGRTRILYMVLGGGIFLFGLLGGLGIVRL